MTKIHKRKFRGKLKYKYLSAFIGVSLFLALVLTFAYYWYFNRMYEQQTGDYIRNMGRESVNSLEQTMEQINTVILSIQSEDIIQEYLYGVDHHQYTTTQQAKVQGNVRDTVYSNILWTDSIINVYMESNNGFSEVWEKSGGGVIWNRDRRQYIYNGRGKAVWLGLDDSGRFMQVGAQINSKKNMSVLGFLILQIPANDFENQVENMSFIRDGKSLIVDQNMDVIISTDDEVKEAPEEIQDILTEEAAGHHLFQMDIGGIDSYVYIGEMKYADWYMVSIIPRMSYMGVLHDLRVVIGVLCVAVLTVVSILIFYIVSRFTRGIEHLQNAMHRFGEGDFNVICAVRTDDEIGELSQHFNMMVYNINDLVDRVYNANMLRQKSELESLRMQINPHFLYNTLDMVAWISRDKGVPEVADIAVSLSNMLRYTIKGPAMTDLGTELENIRHYLTIQRYRYGDRIQFVIQAPESLMKFRLPKMLIQPLVENAIIHGVENIAQGIVMLDIQKDKDRVRICVSDNGVGMDQKKIDEILGGEESLILESRDSIGLRNVNRRLKIHYGEYHGLTIQSVPGGGTSICIWIPLEEDAELTGTENNS